MCTEKSRVSLRKVESVRGGHGYQSWAGSTRRKVQRSVFQTGPIKKGKGKRPERGHGRSSKTGHKGSEIRLQRMSQADDERGKDRQKGNMESTKKKTKQARKKELY